MAKHQFIANGQSRAHSSTTPLGVIPLNSGAEILKSPLWNAAPGFRHVMQSDELAPFIRAGSTLFFSQDVNPVALTPSDVVLVARGDEAPSPLFYNAETIARQGLTIRAVMVGHWSHPSRSAATTARGEVSPC